jgi:hypothetical protein
MSSTRNIGLFGLDGVIQRDRILNLRLLVNKGALCATRERIHDVDLTQTGRKNLMNYSETLTHEIESDLTYMVAGYNE